jgi:MFS family permease
MRAALHRGYWLVTSLYLVLDAGLSPLQLVLIGSAQSLVSLVFEVPTGVVADTLSRKWSLVASHLLIGASMLATGLVTSFPALAATQMLWGLGWTFASGADVAWITDELGERSNAAVALTAQARWEQIGAASGMLGFGIFAWAIDRSTAMVLAGAMMALLGLYVAARFSEQQFRPTRAQHWRTAATLLRRGLALAHRDHVILLVFAATFLVNGAAEVFGRLYPKQLVDLGLPDRPGPIVWFTGLGIVSFAVGALALRLVEAYISQESLARRVYRAACGVGALGLLLLAIAPDAISGSVGVLLVSGIAWTVTRTVGAIWINAHVTNEVRATVQSFLGQAEYIGEISCGVALALLAQKQSIGAALMGAGVLVVCAGLMVVIGPIARR